MSNTQPTNVGVITATGEEIGNVINTIEEALIGTKKGHASIALLAMFVQLQYPDISQENAFRAVQEISEYICVYLDGIYQEQNGSAPSVN